MNYAEYVGHCEPISLNDMDIIESAIDDYMDFYRQNVSQSILPKHHILEDHVLTFIEQWQFGLGLHGEQGIESIHAEINCISKSKQSIRDPLQKLRCTLIDHHLKVSPEIQAAVIYPHKRPKKSGKDLE